MKKIVVVAGTLAVLAGIALAAYAAYDITGSSPAQGFTSGTAQNLAVDPEEWDLTGILPGETKTMDVSITNNNSVAVTVTGLTLLFNDGGVCQFSYTPLGTYPFSLGASLTAGVQVNVTMGTWGDADPSCENNSTLTVTATATGTLP